MINLEIFWSEFKFPPKIPSQVEEVFRKEIKKEVETYDKLTHSWKKRHQPTWKVKIFTRKDLWGYTLQSRTPIFVYLSEGTRERFARMDKGYKKKSRPGKFGTFGSGGKVAARGRRNVGRAFAVTHAIKPGNWHYKMAEMAGPRLAIGLTKAFKKFSVEEYGANGKRVKRRFVRFTVIR